MNINFFKCVSNVAILSLLCSWSYQTRGFHLLITSWYIFPVEHFTLAPFFAFSLTCLSYMNKSFVMKMSYLLPRAKLLRVTFFMKRSYLLPRENFKLPYLPNQGYWDPGICTQLRSSHIHFYTPKIVRFHPRELCVIGPYLCRLIQPRLRGEEGNCSYLLPLSHRGAICEHCHRRPQAVKITSKIHRPQNRAATLFVTTAIKKTKTTIRNFSSVRVFGIAPKYAQTLCPLWSYFINSSQEDPRDLFTDIRHYCFTGTGVYCGIAPAKAK